MADLPTETLMDERDLARFLHISVALVRRWRQTGEGPAVLRVGRQLCRYRPADVNAWLDAQYANRKQEVA